MITKTCPICGKMFTAGAGEDRPRHSKYCSQACLEETWKRENKATSLERAKRYRERHPERVVEIRKRHEATEKYKMTRAEYERRDYEKLRQWRKDANRGIKARLTCLKAYGGEDFHCTCCGEDRIEFMTLDHITNDGAEHRKIAGYGSAFYRWLIKNKFPPGLQVLCWNCNEAKAHYGICPHETERQLSLGSK